MSSPGVQLDPCTESLWYGIHAKILGRCNPLLSHPWDWLPSEHVDTWRRPVFLRFNAWIENQNAASCPYCLSFSLPLRRSRSAAFWLQGLAITRGASRPSGPCKGCLPDSVATEAESCLFGQVYRKQVRRLMLSLSSPTFGTMPHTPLPYRGFRGFRCIPPWPCPLWLGSGRGLGGLVPSLIHFVASRVA